MIILPFNSVFAFLALVFQTPLMGEKKEKKES